MKSKIFKALIIAILSANVVYAEGLREMRMSSVPTINIPMSKVDENYEELYGSKWKFIKDKNGVYIYSYDDTVKKFIGLDPETVDALNKSYLKDKNGIYYFDGDTMKVINSEGVDLKTLEGVDNSYLKDKDSVYLIDENRLRRLERLDPATFRNAGAGYVRDKNGVYKYYKTYITFDDKDLKREPIFDARSFRIIDADGRYVRDRNNVYLDNKKIEGADPSTFEILKKDNITYAKDKNNIYYWGNKIEGAEKYSFEIMDDPSFSRDIHNIYFLGKKTDKKSYPSEYEKRGNDVYRYNKKLEGIDANTFEKMSLISGFKDKNGYYVIDKDKNVVKIDDKEIDMKNIFRSGDFLTDGNNLYYIKDRKLEKIKNAPKYDSLVKYSDKYIEIKGNLYYLDTDTNELTKLRRNSDMGYFEVLSEDYAKDLNMTDVQELRGVRRYVYFKGKVLENADYDSFGIKYNDQKNAFEIRDKNRVYETLKNE